MRCLKRNQRTIYYCPFVSDSVPQYDEYGNLLPETAKVYGAAVAMKANVSPATGQSRTEQFGGLENYDKVIVTSDMTCPIDEQSVLFIDKDPVYGTQGEPLYDYTVRRVAKSLNSISIAVKKVTVS